jgi:uncharacterized protein
VFGIKPREEKFYELFEEATDLVCQGAASLKELMANHAIIGEKVAEINEIEHKADVVTAAIIDRLNQTLITPMDREDIYTLASVLDDIIDFIQGSVERMVLYKTGQPSKGAQELVRVLYESTLVIKTSFGYLRNIRSNKNRIIENACKISDLESQADKLYRQEVAHLFEEEKNPIEVIKWKEILEHLETAVDHCEDIGDLLKGVVLKYA